MSRSAQSFDSRQSMKNKKFEIFHYRDKKPGSVNMHYHDFYEVYFFLSGQVSFRVEGTKFDLMHGDLLLIPPMQMHQLQIEEDSAYERYVLWMDRAYLQSLGGSELDLAACFASGAPNHLRPSRIARAELGNLLEKLVKEFYGQDIGSSIYAQGLLQQFMVEINRIVNSAPKKEPQKESPDLAGQILTYIGNHYRENITLETLASEFFVSKYYLSHEFSHQVGTSVYRYVILRRLLMARELMAAGHAPGTIYQNCGFTDYTNFYRAFKSEYGISPRQYFAEFTK